MKMGAIMNSYKHRLPMFPIDIFLLPGGVTRLRIFEPRYLKLVSLATSGNGFIIAANNKSPLQLRSWGSWVEIINFDQGQDGVLEIDIECKSLVEIEDVNLEKNGLYYVDVNPFAHWSQKQSQKKLLGLHTSIQSLINNNSVLNELYNNKIVDNPYWIIARWIELLPLPVDVKNNFIFESSYSDAKKLVISIVID